MKSIGMKAKALSCEIITVYSNPHNKYCIINLNAVSIKTINKSSTSQSILLIQYDSISIPLELETQHPLSNHLSLFHEIFTQLILKALVFNIINT